MRLPFTLTSHFCYNNEYMPLKRPVAPRVSGKSTGNQKSILPRADDLWLGAEEVFQRSHGELELRVEERTAQLTRQAAVLGLAPRHPSIPLSLPQIGKTLYKSFPWTWTP
jgi:hypothetical protein